MRAYPTVLTMPNRKQRKSQRSQIFAENRSAVKIARKARREARKQTEGK